MFHTLRTILLQGIALPLAIISGPLFRILRHVLLESEFWLETSLKRHEEEVAKIVEQVKVWIKSGRGTKMATARPGWKNISVTKTDKSKYFQVHVGLDRIIALEEKEESITVEPGVMIGQLSRYLFKRGWTIPVVPELDSLSIGGLICGVGIESSSHKRGLFHETVLSYEVVLADGRVVKCSKDKESDLFHAIPGSFATIGFLTAVTIPLIPAKRFVKLNYRPASSIAGLNSLLKSEPNHDFVESLAFSKNEIVVMFGDMVDTLEPRKSVNYINRWYKLFFHDHAHSILKKGRDSYVEYVPLIDYYHRHSKGIFWVIPGTVPITGYSVFMFLLGWTLTPHIPAQRILPVALWKLFGAGQVIQDYILPINKAQNLFDKADEILKIYPVWLCPVEMKKNKTMFRSLGNGDYLDIGYYGHPAAANFHPVGTLQDLEKECIANDGFQLLYAESFMSRGQFRDMFDTTTYDKVRESYDCSAAFPDVYDKVGPKARNLAKAGKSR